MPEFKYTIPLPPVTKKNHSRIVTFGKRCPVCKKGSTTKLLPSIQYEKYSKEIKPYLKELKKLTDTINYPVNLKCIFYCATRRPCDLVGHLQAIQDLMTDNKIIVDDKRDVIASTDGSAVMYDKQNPRTEIMITAKEDYEQWSLQIQQEKKPKRRKSSQNQSN